MDCLSVVI